MHSTILHLDMQCAMASQDDSKRTNGISRNRVTGVLAESHWSSLSYSSERGIREAVLGCACSLILTAYPFHWQGRWTALNSARCTIPLLFHNESSCSVNPPVLQAEVDDCRML